MGLLSFGRAADENFAALANFQQTQDAGACHPQKQSTRYYAGGTER
jgi:hypothetical protein